MHREGEGNDEVAKFLGCCLGFRDLESNYPIWIYSK